MFLAKRPARCAASSPRPKGLWKAKSQARVVSVPVISERQPLPSPPRSPPPPSSSAASSSSSSWSSTLISLEDQDGFFEDWSSSSSSSGSSSSSFKRRRVALDCGDEDQYEDPEQVYLWDYSSFRPSSTSAASLEKKKMDILPPTSGPSRQIPRQRVYSSIGLLAEDQEGDDEFTWNHWEELQSMFSPFENDFEADVTSTQYLPTLRAIVHECQRFLSLYPNPSPFFLRHSSSTPPTAVYTLLGHTLFVFGLIISVPSSTSELLDSEPQHPAPYWLAALDVFTIGDSLAGREEDLSCADVEVDWRMSFTWGMTMIRLSRELVEGGNTESYSSSQTGSPFDFIAINRPPHTPSSTTPEVKELLKYAMDQITRGIFHMPRLTTPPLVSNAPRSTFISLLSIAIEVLCVASQLPSPSDQAYWLRWADSLFSSASGNPSTVTAFSSMSLGASLSDTTVPLCSSAGVPASVYRGRCNFLLARALLEAGAGVGEDEDEWKEEVKDALENAIEFLEEGLTSEAQTLAGSKRKWVDVEMEEGPLVWVVDGEKTLRESRELLERFT